MPVFSRFSHYTEPLAAQILRRCMGGKRYFLSLIFQSVALLLSLVAAMVQVFETQGTMNALLVESGAPASTIAASSVGGLVGGIIGVVVTAAAGSLQMVSAWMIFAAARSRKSPMGTAGFTMQKIMAIISLGLIGLYLLLVVLLFSMLSGLVTLVAGAFSGGAAAVGFVNVFLVIMVVILALSMGYAVAVAIASLLTAQRMRSTARTGLPGKPIPLFFVVAMFIDVAGLALAVLLMIPSMILSFTVGTLLATLAYIPGIVYPILRGLVLLEYRRELKELQNFAPSHAYVPAPAPAPEQKEAVQPLLRPYSAQERPSSPEDPQADRIRCPHCGASHAKDAVFCGSCGKELS